MKELRTEPQRTWVHLSSSDRGDNPKAAYIVNGTRNNGIYYPQYNNEEWQRKGGTGVG